MENDENNNCLAIEEEDNNEKNIKFIYKLDYKGQ